MRGTLTGERRLLRLSSRVLEDRPPNITVDRERRHGDEPRDRTPCRVRTISPPASTSDTRSSSCAAASLTEMSTPAPPVDPWSAADVRSGFGNPQRPQRVHLRPARRRGRTPGASPCPTPSATHPSTP